MDRQAAADAVPRGRGNYEVHGQIARGGMGQILKARDTDLGREVAIKVLDARLAGKPFVLRRFVEEAQIGGQLQHPGVVPVYEMGMMSDERPYFAMKLVKGRTLSALLDDRKDLSDDRRRHLAIFESVCQTMAYAHSKGVIHRDLKPANVMVGSFGEVLVVDWGLAKVLGQGGVDDEKRAQQSNLTVIETVRSGPGSSGSDSVVGSVMGTPAYMPPEQAMGEVERLDERSDVFSLGAILCEILTGKPPYVDDGNERIVVLAAQAMLEPARARIAACQADEELKRLCVQCLAPAPAVRPRNAGEVADKIHQFLAHLEHKAHAAELAATEARVKAEGERRAKRLTLALAAAVILALVCVGGAAYWMDMQQRGRVVDARRSFDEALAQVVSLQQEERWGDAVEVARTTLASVTGSGVADEAMREQARRSLDLAEEHAEKARVLAERERRNSELVASLEAIQVEQLDAFVQDRFLDFHQRFLDAFAAYGVDLAGQDFVEAYEVLRDGGVATSVVSALDDWARMRRGTRDADRHDADKLTMLAIDLDADDLHTRVREAILKWDQSALSRFADEAIELDLGPALVWAIGGTLWDMGKREEVFALFDRGTRRYPDDFLLNLVTAFLFQNNGRPDRAIPVSQKAVTLRPDSAFAHVMLGTALLFSGDDAAAVPVFREAIRADPSRVRGHLGLGWSLWSLGDLDRAADALSEAARLDPRDVETGLDLLSVECLRGEVSVEELLERLDAIPGPGPGMLFSVGLVLVNLSELSPAHARRALEIGERAARLSPVDPTGWRVWADAALRLGDPGEALEILARADVEITTTNAQAPAESGYLRALAHHALGNSADARAAFDRAEHRRELLTQFRAAEWEQAYLSKLRQRAARALGRQ